MLKACLLYDNFMVQHFTPVSSGARLSDQVAEQLTAEIKQGRLLPGDKLPTEARLVTQFQVSRTVVREAVSRLKSLGLVDSRQGSGVFVNAKLPFAPLNFESRHAASQEAVIQMVEVRRATSGPSPLPSRRWTPRCKRAAMAWRKMCSFTGPLQMPRATPF